MKFVPKDTHPNGIPVETPFWVILGPDCFPEIFCAKLNDVTGPRVIWGYSIYKNAGGFRTLGQDFSSWVGGHAGAKFFLIQADAMEYLNRLVTPNKTALAKLKPFQPYVGETPKLY